MATKEAQAQEHDEYSKAFNEPEQQKPEQTEDEAFGIGPEPQGDAESGADEGSEQSAGGDSGGATTVVEPEGSETAAEEDGAPNPEDHEIKPEDDGPTDPKDIQRQKSWEGRLNAREAQLKAREEALKAGKPDGDDAGESPEEEAAESPETEAIEQAAEAVQSGEMSVDEALKSLSADFGDDFGKMLNVLITAKAKEAAGQVADEKFSQVDKKVGSLASGLQAKAQQDHYETIAEAHPDFAEVANGPDMQVYVDSLPEDQKAQAQQVIKSGTARQIVKLLSAVKQHSAANEPKPEDHEVPDEGAMDAAEGVRSRGIKIPEKPKGGDSYEDAWNQF